MTEQSTEATALALEVLRAEVAMAIVNLSKFPDAPGDSNPFFNAKKLQAALDRTTESDADASSLLAQAKLTSERMVAAERRFEDFSAEIEYLADQLYESKDTPIQAIGLWLKDILRRNGA